jgi:osmotically-inducible protein OsmY
MKSTSGRQDASRFAAVMTIALLICAMGCSAHQPVVTRDDASITSDVRARLAADAQSKSLGVTVDTNAGIVHLTGNVPTDSDRSSVERIARDAPGVLAVDNNVRFGDALNAH